jgi:hypothetical protein
MMNLHMKRTALSLSLLTALASPMWASGSAFAAGEQVISAQVASARLDQVPSSVTVDGKKVKFDQGPVMVAGVLMVPVRAIAEAGGGIVTWDVGIQLVHIRMPERTIMIRLGHLDAEMHQDGVTYLDRNRIMMQKEPVLMGGRTLVSADTLTIIFGFDAVTGDDGSLNLTSPSSPGSSERGTVTKAEGGDQPRILLSGAAMANGEPRLTWASITAQTKITIEEGGKTRSGSPSDVKVGAQVDVKWAGPLEMSYPASGAAAEILVHN